jgi:hypothetical protein
MSGYTQADPRHVLEALGPAKVKALLSQQLLVWHLIQPAHAWLTELDEKEKADATHEGVKPGSDVSEHQDGSGGREAAEASGGDRLP